MDTGAIQVAGVMLRSPVTAGTNLMLAITSAGIYTRIGRTCAVRTRMWRGFFLAVTVATLAGVPKHLFGYYAASFSVVCVTLLSSLSGGASIYYAQRATLESGLFSPRGRVGLLWLVRLQLLVFAIQLLLTGTFIVVLVQTGLGLAGVLMAEWSACRRGFVGHRWIVAGMAASLLPGVAYILHWPSSLWFNHNDLAHVLMGVSLVLVFRGAQLEAGAPVIP